VRGLRLSFRGDDRAAAKAFDRALAAAPGSTSALLNRALVRQRLGDLDGARADFDRAIRSSPGDARGYYFRSLLLRSSGDGDGADKDLQKAIDLMGDGAQ
ncbi:MAG TPA: tetratricopeptide repeat protein, partial [Erythrobacter sp.]